MKRIVTIAALLLVFFTGSAQKRTYVIGFYNLENLFDSTTTPPRTTTSSCRKGPMPGPRPNIKRNSPIWPR